MYGCFAVSCFKPRAAEGRTGPARPRKPMTLDFRLHPETLRELKSFKWGIGKLHSVAFSPDGTLGAAGGDKGQVALWDVDD